MPADFDPYYKWLGIPRDEQPPNLYRLLGLRVFESDADVIANASDQRMALLKTFAIGKYTDVSERLLNEVARARIRLLNPTKRLAYDVEIRDRLAGLSQHTVASAPDQPQTLVDLHTAWDSAPSNSAPAANSQIASELRTSEARRTLSPSNVPLQDVDQFTPLPLTTISKSATIGRRQPRGLPSLIGVLIMAAVSGAIGLAAAYFLLCVINIRYDFLHLLSAKTAQSPPVVNKPNHRGQPQQPPITTSYPYGHEEEEHHIPPRPFTPPRRKEGTDRPPRSVPTDPPPVTPPPEDQPSKPNPFSDFPLLLPLPKSIAASGPTPLASVPIKDLTGFELSLVDDPNSQRTKLKLERQPQDDQPWNWEVRREDDASATIANFSIKKDDLLFDWSPRLDRLSAAALRNAVLRIDANGYQHFVTLREPTYVEGYVIDPGKIPDRISFHCDDPPEQGSLRLDILEMTNAPKFDVEGDGLLGMKVGEENILRYHDAKEAATRIKFIATNDRLIIEVESRYQLPSGARDALEPKRLSRKLENLRNASTAKKQDPQLQAEAQAVERIMKITDALHKNVSVKYRFYSVVAGHEVVLATVP